jgi:hypothetical protein
VRKKIYFSENCTKLHNGELLHLLLLTKHQMKVNGVHMLQTYSLPVEAYVVSFREREKDSKSP